MCAKQKMTTLAQRLNEMTSHESQFSPDRIDNIIHIAHPLPRVTRLIPA